ncbi:zincin-like metallopeptidase domain-containing protein [Rhizobium sp. P28RR-XV]|uniref:zincin-like metallopeptidase domain-containing protein n=1 Tax=Rhizobium sp. P28RR-XV TaxID=2726737 RepID=UPI0039181E8F
MFQFFDLSLIGGVEIERDIPYMKGYTVFNVEQIEGLPEQYTVPSVPVLDPVQRIDGADIFFAATGADIRHGGNRAFYSQSDDRIQLPPFEAFKDAESYYATLAHEQIHYAVSRIMPNLIRTALELNTNYASMVGIIATSGKNPVCFPLATLGAGIPLSLLRPKP